MFDFYEGPVIRVNQEGYAEGLPVYAAILTKGLVELKDETGKILPFEAEPLKLDEASDDRVTVANLGRLKAGTYILESPEGNRTLTVSARPWNAVTGALIKGLYYQRCGCELKPEHAGAYTHPACHTAPATDWEDRSIQRRITGGWHDAGDYGKYVGPGAVTVAHLLYTWKLFPEGCPDNLNIPESGNGVPDILNEARYELEWILQMQRSDGAFHHKLTKMRFAPFIMPQDDKEPEYLMPVNPAPTAAACACLALASRVYRAFDGEFAERTLQSARKAWEWLRNNTEYKPFLNPEGVYTGWYCEKTDRDDRFWAACEMLAATGEEEYRKAAEELYGEGQQLTHFGWADVGGLGALCCLFELGEKAGEVLYTKLKEDFLGQSEEALKLSQASGYGTALAWDNYVWGSILPIMSNAMAMIMNALLTGRQEMRDAALKQWNYALGMNALDICFVTGFGENRVMHPHHRPSDADGIEDPVPGLISGGPNNKMCFPQTKEKLGENTPPAKYYVEETFSADTNEIAIYWNSPAIFVGAYFNRTFTE